MQEFQKESLEKAQYHRVFCTNGGKTYRKILSIHEDGKTPSFMYELFVASSLKSYEGDFLCSI